MKGISLPLWEARRLLGPTPRLHALPTRVRSGSAVFRWLNMTVTRNSSSSLIRDTIRLSPKDGVLANSLLVGGIQDIEKIKVVLNTPLGVGTTTETIDTSVDHRRSANVFGAAFPRDARSAQDLGRALNNSLLASSRDIRGCNVRIEFLPKASDSFHTHGGRMRMVHKALVVSKWTAVKAEYEKIPATVASQHDSSETSWSMELPLGLLSGGNGRNSFILLRITLHREYRETYVPCSTPNSTKPEIEEFSPQALGVAAVPDDGALDFDIHERLVILARATSFSTAEALCSYLADEAYALADSKYPKSSITRVAIKITRPTTGEGVRHATVVVVRGRSDLSHPPDEQLAALKAQGKHRAIVALGANIGDRISNIEEACRVMDSRGMRVIQTSLMYETEAMYVVNQDPFINGACEVSKSPENKTPSHRNSLFVRQTIRYREVHSLTAANP